MTSPLKTECPHCYLTFPLKNRSAVGKKVRCKSCGSPFTIQLAEDEIEEYGEVPPSPASQLPPQRSKQASNKRSDGPRKKRRMQSSVPWRAVVLSVVVLIVIGVGWKLISESNLGGLSLSKLLKPSRSAEELVDAYIQSQYGVIEKLKAVKSRDDFSKLKDQLSQVQETNNDLVRDLILLSPLSEARSTEVLDYLESQLDLHQKTITNQMKSELARIDGLGIFKTEIRDLARSLQGLPFTSSYLSPIPEARSEYRVDLFHRELVEAKRDLAKLLIPLKNVKALTSHQDQIQAAIDQFQDLRNHPHHGRVQGNSPFFFISNDWDIVVFTEISRLNNLARGDSQLTELTKELSLAVNFVETTPPPSSQIPGSVASRSSQQATGITPSSNSEINGRLKPLGLAFHNYHDQFKSFPSHDRDAEGHVGLSWRVHLLQQLDPDLYNQFDLNAPARSQENIKLLNSRPDFYQSQYSAVPHNTCFRVFAGEGTPVGSSKLVSLKDIVDGSSNTILVIETGRNKAQPWTHPGGIRYSTGMPINMLGKVDADGYYALMCDGSVRRISNKIDPQGFQSLIEVNNSRR